MILSMTMILTAITSLTLAAPAPPPAPAPWTELQTADFHGVIVPASEKASNGLDRASGARIDGFWTPDEASVRAFEAGVAAYLKAAKPRRSPELYKKIAPYKRQWVGLTVEGGRELIAASFMCDVRGDAWKRSLQRTSDGGDCYFEVVYDVKAKTYSDLYVHGEA